MPSGWLDVPDIGHAVAEKAMPRGNSYLPVESVGLQFI